MGGCGFQEKRDSHSAFHRKSEDRAAKNRSFAETNSDELGNGESTSALEDENELQPSQRLGVCQPCQERHAALLAKIYLSLYQASSRQNWPKKAYRVAHLPSYIWDDPERQWREPQSDSGTPASCQSQGHNGHLRPGCHGRKTSGAEQGCEDASSGYSQGSDLVNGLFWTRGEIVRDC